MENTPLPPRPAPDPKKQMNQFITIFIFVFAMFVLFDQNMLREREGTCPAKA